MSKVTTKKKAGIQVLQDGEEALSPRQVMQMVKVNARARVATCIWGQPGIGKSMLVAEMCRQEGWGFIDVRAAYFDPVDLRGIPAVIEDPETGQRFTVWCRPGFLPREDTAFTIVLCDELNRGTPMVQNALFQAIQEGRIGEHDLGPNVYVMAACNYDTDGGGLHTMPAALKNRFSHLHMETHEEEWRWWAYTAGINPSVIGYHKKTGGVNLFSFDREAKAWPSPRAWHNLSKVSLELQQEFPFAARKHENNDRRNARQRVMKSAYAGIVGPGAGFEYWEYENMTIDLPSPEEIFKDPEGCRLPEEPSALYAVCAGLAAQVEMDTADSMIRYVMRISKEMRSEEYSVMAVRDVFQRNNDLITVPSFKNWAQHHDKYIKDLR